MNRLNLTRNEQDEPTIEQIRKVIELAEQFDKLQAMPGWEKALRRMAENINSELASVTSYKYEPERQRIGVVRWDAKRELLDDMQGYIEAQQRERDRIAEEAKESMRGRSNEEGNRANAW